VDALAYDVAMRAALEEARLTRDSGDVPIGAVVLDPSGVVIGRALYDGRIDPAEALAAARS